MIIVWHWVIVETAAPANRHAIDYVRRPSSLSAQRVYK